MMYSIPALLTRGYRQTLVTQGQPGTGKMLVKQGHPGWRKHPLQTCNECICLPYRQLCLNNKASLYPDRVLYGTVTLVAAKTDLRLPLAGDTLSSAREGRVRYVQCEDRRYCVPSVIDLTGGGKTRRRVGLPSLSDLTVEEARAGGRETMSPQTIGQRSGRWRRGMA